MKKILIFIFAFTLSACTNTSDLSNNRQSLTLPPWSRSNTTESDSATPKPTPVPFTTYTAPPVDEQKVYEVALLGDSMTAALGPHGGPFTEQLNDLYQNHDILVDNYAVGSTNLSTIDKRLTEQTQFNEWIYQPLLERPEIDLIIIESFAYNPLSDITNRGDALARQRTLLTELMTRLTNELPNTRIAFAATIAPSRNYYNQKIGNLDNSQSTIQANERIEYLENHIRYAREHNIPLINIYQNTLTPDGDGNLEYINPDDYIHPSATGINLISTTMAETIYSQGLLPD